MKFKSVAVSAAITVLMFANIALAADTMKVGVTTTGVPFTFIDTASQRVTGSMVDLASAIGQDLGVQPEFEVTAFSSLIPSLDIGKIDVISAGMLVTEARKKAVDFSDPVYSYGDVMFVAADNTENYTIEALKGEVVGAQIGTTFADELKGLGTFKEVKLYDGIADIMRDVKLGRIKAGFGDQPIIAYQIQHNPALGVRIVDGYKPMKTGYVALAVSKKNPELLNKINSAIAKLKTNGELTKIFAKYGL
ncbi:ABC transporter substrate-binding protein [Brucella pseudogrignonensis]|uniref:ABC transporter substrate-binding protein n=1 Tax=Brucella pseudogrignonensis TaxID=419475 RepID=UPI003D9761E3